MMLLETVLWGRNSPLCRGCITLHPSRVHSKMSVELKWFMVHSPQHLKT